MPLNNAANGRNEVTHDNRRDDRNDGRCSCRTGGRRLSGDRLVTNGRLTHHGAWMPHHQPPRPILAHGRGAHATFSPTQYPCTTRRHAARDGPHNRSKFERFASAHQPSGSQNRCVGSELPAVRLAVTTASSTIKQKEGPGAHAKRAVGT